ncbi:hypothetical protein JL193_12495 [Polaribacter batillariae]|uniref:Beta-lactamase-inhibitor-like PepSY-like domain-containing protein n=1 Tax=Polaribacter batillariae TaxID=2808900 RepID=A0ABX7SRR1_9FLAO|nr:hypothetical protein [Polaribacter batillariae]QTD36939.1 hypothetical protein JL193_12495 [Polaribacter batillariae]
MKKLHLLLAIVLLTFSMKAQDVAMVTPIKFDEKNRFKTSDDDFTPLLEETTYTYKYKGKNVLVIYTKDEHVEYFENKKYFIKSDIKWTSEEECYMTLKESNLPNFPFKRGTKLHMKIKKIKRGSIYYETTLGGYTWEGKMKKI